MATKPLLDKDTATYYAKYYRQALATAPACAVSVLAGSPLENVKTRMQSRYFSSALACTKYTFQTEGLRGFFSGTVAPLLSITISRTFSFSIYRQAKYKIDDVIESVTGVSPLQHVNKMGTFPNLSTVVCFGGAGMIAGGAMATVLTPFELIKNCTQTSVLMANSNGGSNAAKNAGRVSSQDAVRQIIRDRGFRGLYTGFRLHFLRDTLGSGIYFGVYEAVKQSLNSAYGADQVNAPGSVAFAGAVCGIVAWGVTYPLDSMKTQAQNRLVGQGARNAISSAATSAAKSAAGFSKWKGIEMAIIRSAFQNMIQMSIFERAKTIIDGTEFSNGSKTLPEIERELGRDQLKERKEMKRRKQIKKNEKL